MEIIEKYTGKVKQVEPGFLTKSKDVFDLTIEDINSLKDYRDNLDKLAAIRTINKESNDALWEESRNVTRFINNFQSII